jgi:hypothetical protein
VREQLEQARARVDRVVEAEVAVREEDVPAHLAASAAPSSFICALMSEWPTFHITRGRPPSSISS